MAMSEPPLLSTSASSAVRALAFKSLPPLDSTCAERALPLNRKSEPPEASTCSTPAVTSIVRSLPPEAETSVYRIVQEALTNVVRHADARHVSVVVTRKNASVSVVIEDDGKGFEPERAAEGGGVGLLGMRERVQLLDGTLSVESSPGAGTTLVLDLPVR